MPKEIPLYSLSSGNCDSVKNTFQNFISFQTGFKNQHLNSESQSGCRLQELNAKRFVKKDTATYWPVNWRSKLCTCKDCMVSSGSPLCYRVCYGPMPQIGPSGKYIYETVARTVENSEIFYIKQMYVMLLVV